MNYRLNIILKTNYLHVFVSGAQTMDGNIKLITDCVEACKKNRVNRVLLYIRKLTGQPGTVADYELAKLLTAWEAAKTISHAALLEKEQNLPAGRFFETASQEPRDKPACLFGPEKSRGMDKRVVLKTN